MDYHDFNDYELLSYIEENNEEANNIIYKKYEPLIVNTANRMYPFCKNNGIELGDLIQEGMVGLNLAINSFDLKKNIKFYTYARTCIERAIMSFTIRSNRKKNKILNESICFDSPDIEEYKIRNIISDNSFNPEKHILDSENEKETIERIKEELTDFEYQVFELKLAGFSYREISEILDKSIKAIDNALQRIKGKVKGILNL